MLVPPPWLRAAIAACMASASPLRPTSVAALSEKETTATLPIASWIWSTISMATSFMWLMTPLIEPDRSSTMTRSIGAWHSGADGGADGTHSAERSPQSVQSVPKSQTDETELAPPSSHAPSDLYPHVSSHMSGHGGSGGGGGELA
jgi:hypothetical protein